MNLAESIYLDAYQDGIRPDPDYTVSQWADANRVLTTKTSAEPGPWRTERVPYLRGIMDALSPADPCQRIAFMKGTQLGGSEAGYNWLGFIVDMTPGPLMVVYPTTDIAKSVSKQRIASMTEEVERLQEKIKDSRARDSGNTILEKEFPGGMMKFVGANSAAGLRSMPARFLFIDEADAMPVDVEGEGDPLDLAEKRTQTFSRRKIFICSTPVDKETSKIEFNYEKSDKRRYFVPCPHCQQKQWLKFGGDKVPYGLKWMDEDPRTVFYICEHCGAAIEEKHKTWMLENGEWEATAKGDGVTVGFHLSSLYSPLGWKSWAEIVREFIDAKGNATRLKTFVNTILGETWEDEYAARLGADGLQARAELYEVGTCPEGGVLVTAGVDVQPNRLAIVVRAWGDQEESWGVHHMEIFGDPTRPEVWAQLDNVLATPVKHASGADLMIYAAAIDTGGHNTHDVYEYVRVRKALYAKMNGKCTYVLGIKGMSTAGKPVIGKPTAVDINKRGQVLKAGADLYPVGVDTVKDVLFNRLKLSEDGEGTYHFPVGFTADYYEQLTAESKKVTYFRGHKKYSWVKKNGARNEALDCEVYNYVALNWIYTKFNRNTIFSQFREKVKSSVNGGNIRENQKKIVGQRQKSSSSFVNNW